MAQEGKVKVSPARGSNITIITASFPGTGGCRGNSQHEVSDGGALTEIAHAVVLQGITAWTPEHHQEAVQIASKMQQEVSLNATSLIFSLHTLPCLSPGPVPHLQLSSPCEHRRGVSPSAQGRDVGVLERLSPDSSAHSSAHSARARPPWETRGISLSAAAQVLCCKRKSALLSHLKALILADI